MNYAVDLTDVDVFTKLRQFLLMAFPGVEVVKGQDNQVPMPKGRFITMTPMLLGRLSTNRVKFTDDISSSTHLRASTEPTEVTIQLDVFGSNAQNDAQLASSTFRDLTTAEWFRSNGGRVVPLFADDPRQMQFINAESQYEDRWSVDVHLQINPTYTTTQEFGDKVVVTTIPVA